MSKIVLISINGKRLKSGEELFFAHGFHYGDNAFEGIRFYTTRKGIAIFCLEEHVKRLLFSAKSIGIKSKFNKPKIIHEIKKLVKESKLKEGYIRPLIFSKGGLGINNSNLKADVVIIVVPFKHDYKMEVSADFSSIKRISPSSTNIKAKISGNYINSVLAIKEVRKRNFDEAILLDEKGFISEGAVQNIFFVKKKTLYTPRENFIFPGITREIVFEISKKFKLKVIKTNISKEEVNNFDEAFFVGTASGVVPLFRIGKKKFENKISLLIRDEYEKIVHGEDKSWEHKLTFC